MKSLPRHRRAVVLVSAGAIIASSAPLLASRQAHGGFDLGHFGLGAAVGMSAALLAAAILKFRMR